MSDTVPATRPQRPFTVTVVLVLVWIVALVNIIEGIILMFDSNNVEVLLQYNGNKNTVLIAGIIQIVFGLIVALVATSLGKGSQFARFLISLLMILDIIADVVFVSQNGSRYLWGTVLAILFALVILILLWNSKASRFFKPASYQS
jgi:hypothetical protein